MAVKLTHLQKPILNLEGQPLVDAETGKELAIGNLIANVLARGQSKDPVRAMMVAMQLHGKTASEVDDADVGLITESVKDDRLLNNTAKAAILTLLLNGQAKTV